MSERHIFIFLFVILIPGVKWSIVAYGSDLIVPNTILTNILKFQKKVLFIYSKLKVIMVKVDYVDLELETGINRVELENYLKGTCFSCPTTSKCLRGDCPLFDKVNKICLQEIAAEFGAKAILYHEGVQNSLSKN